MFAEKAELAIWQWTAWTLMTLDSFIDGVGARKGAGADKKRSKAQRTVSAAVAKARSRDAWSAIAKITEVVDGRRRFRNQPPLLTRLEVDDGSLALVNTLFHDYRSTLQDDRQELLKRYELVDVGHKVVGVGSVGLLAFVKLMRGRDDNDLMVLQVSAGAGLSPEAYHPPIDAQQARAPRRSGQTPHAGGQRLLSWVDRRPGQGEASTYGSCADMKWAPDLARLDRAEREPIRCPVRTQFGQGPCAFWGRGRDRCLPGEGAPRLTRLYRSSWVAYAGQVESGFGSFTAAIADGRVAAREDGAP